MTRELKLIQQVRDCKLCTQLPLGPKPIFQFHPEARKASWDRYYSLQDPGFQSAYETAHDGAKLVANFFSYAASRS